MSGKILDHPEKGAVVILKHSFHDGQGLPVFPAVELEKGNREPAKVIPLKGLEQPQQITHLTRFIKPLRLF